MFAFYSQLAVKVETGFLQFVRNLGLNTVLMKNKDQNRFPKLWPNLMSVVIVVWQIVNQYVGPILSIYFPINQTARHEIRPIH